MEFNAPGYVDNGPNDGYGPSNHGGQKSGGHSRSRSKPHHRDMADSHNMPPKGMVQQGMPQQGGPQYGMQQQGMQQQGGPQYGMQQQGMQQQGMQQQGMQQQGMQPQQNNLMQNPSYSQDPNQMYAKGYPPAYDAKPQNYDQAYNPGTPQSYDSPQKNMSFQKDLNTSVLSDTANLISDKPYRHHGPPSGYAQPLYAGNTPGYGPNGQVQGYDQGYNQGYGQGQVKGYIPDQGQGYDQSYGHGSRGRSHGRQMKGAPMGGHGARKMTGMDKLASLSSVFVKQKFEMLEMLTGCETENRYKVYASNENMDKLGDAIYKCKEKSSFMARNCLSGDCRPFQMKINNETDEDDDDKLFLWLDRPCVCTVYCLNRPEITVHLKENGQDKYLGKVISQWAMCDMVFDIYDERDQLIYNINGDCCQWGLYCNCPCQPCSKIFFEIRTPDGEGVGEIAKVFNNMMQELFTDTDNFGCKFPIKATAEHKALLIATVLFIDFRYFEMSPQQSGAYN